MYWLILTRGERDTYTLMRGVDQNREKVLVGRRALASWFQLWCLKEVGKDVGSAKGGTNTHNRGGKMLVLWMMDRSYLLSSFSPKVSSQNILQFLPFVPSLSGPNRREGKRCCGTVNCMPRRAKSSRRAWVRRHGGASAFLLDSVCSGVRRKQNSNHYTAR